MKGDGSSKRITDTVRVAACEHPSSGTVQSVEHDNDNLVILRYVAEHLYEKRRGRAVIGSSSQILTKTGMCVSLRSSRRDR